MSNILHKHTAAVGITGFSIAATTYTAGILTALGTAILCALWYTIGRQTST
jgi:hypothetical protein